MSATALSKIISEADVQTYERDGVVCLRQVIDKSWIERLRRAAEQVLSAPSEGAALLGRNTSSGRFRRDRFLWTFNDTFKAFAHESPLPAIAARAMRSEAAYLMLDLIFSKEAHSDIRTPWHHDQPYAWYDGSQVCQFWIPLDHVDIESGVLELVRGSHRWGKWFNPISFTDSSSESDEFHELPDIEANRSEYDIVHFDMEPGDCLLFSELTLHAAPGNASDRERHGVAVHYAGDNARYTTRKHYRPPSRDPGIKPGDPFGCDLFPRVWPRR